MDTYTVVLPVMMQRGFVDMANVLSLVGTKPWYHLCSWQSHYYT